MAKTVLIVDDSESICEDLKISTFRFIRQAFGIRAADRNKPESGDG